jgi:hypothetical protein
MPRTKGLTRPQIEALLKIRQKGALDAVGQARYVVGRLIKQGMLRETAPRSEGVPWVISDVALTEKGEAWCREYLGEDAE